MKYRERADGNDTGFTFVKNISLWMSSLTSFSIKPLRVSIFLGILFALLGFAYGLFIVIKNNYGFSNACWFPINFSINLI